jgi:hypothetical protein
MHRLPLLNMCSRETKRLPAAKLLTKLECSGMLRLMLPLEIRKPITSLEPSGYFFVYYYYDWEFGRNYDKNRVNDDGGALFFLVKVIGTEEIVLDYGEAGSSTMCGDGYQHFVVIGKKIGRFELYCTWDGIIL